MNGGYLHPDPVVIVAAVQAFSHRCPPTLEKTMRRIAVTCLTLMTLAVVSLTLSGCIVVPPRHHDRVYVPY
jgi:hypothetical protein